MLKRSPEFAPEREYPPLRHVQGAEIGAEEVPHLTVVENVVARGHGRVRGENRRGSDRLERRPEGMSPCDAFAHALEDHEGRMTLVDVPDARLQPEHADRPHAADAEHDLLAEPHVVAGVVQACGDAPVVFRVFLDFGVEQEERDRSDLHAPQPRMHQSARHRYRDAELAPHRIKHRCHASRLRLEIGGNGVLAALAVDLLREVAVVIE